MPLKRCILLLLMLLAFGCGRSESYKGISLADPRLAEFSELHNIDRQNLGLPPLPAAADVRVERTGGGAYDIMLHIYASPQQRTIAFRRVGNSLEWIHEQALVQGPRLHTTPDGTFHEQIVLTYETQRVSHYRLNQLNVSYLGPDPVLSARNDMTLADVAPTLKLWLGP